MKIRIQTLVFLCFLTLMAGCCRKSGCDAQMTQTKTGIEVLREDGFELLKGKRVGLITNPTGIDRELKSTIDILFEAPEVNLVALYGPEHGVRGDVSAGDKIEDYTDPRTGLKVFSLYGKTRKPTPEMLEGVDVLVYDIQDIGSRSYTFISTMGFAMEAAAENNKEIVILDRPNPLGGERMEGLITREGFFSFVSQFTIPYIHGLTSGELATLLNEELVAADKKCKLTVVKMKDWKRSMDFAQTGLPWVLSSPHVPQAHSCIYYPVSGIIGELHSINIGVGYTLPFELFATEWIENPEALADRMNKLNLDGVSFRPLYYRPYYGQQQGKDLKGVQVYVDPSTKTSLTLVQFYFLQECKKMYPDQDVFANTTEDRLKMFDKVCGSDEVRKLFTKNFQVDDIKAIWEKDVPAFREMAAKYLMY